MTSTSQLSKENVPHNSSTNPAPFKKALVKKNKLKFRNNPSTEVEPENNPCDPRQLNDKYLDNDSMKTLKRDLQKYLPSSGFFLFHTIESKHSVISEKEETDYEFVEFDYVYETNHDTDFKIEIVDNFPLPFNKFHDISQDSFDNLYFVNISLTDKEIKHIEYSTRGLQSSNLRWEYRKEKITASNFYIAAVNKVKPSKKLKSLFFNET